MSAWGMREISNSRLLAPSQRVKGNSSDLPALRHDVADSSRSSRSSEAFSGVMGLRLGQFHVPTLWAGILASGAISVSARPPVTIRCIALGRAAKRGRPRAFAST
jgi:hypothetical protein